MPASRSLTIRADTFEELRVHLLAAYPAEAAGFLGGPESGLIATAIFPLQSVSMVPQRRVVVARRQVSDALDAIRASGLHYVGQYHSHPDGRAEMSRTDVVAADRPGIEVIATVTRYGVGAVRAWLVGPGAGPRPLDVKVAP